VVDPQPGKVAELDRLVRDREDAGDERLRRDRGRGRRERDHRENSPRGHHREERVLERGGVSQEQRALAEVVEEQTRQDDAEPGDADGERTEVPHVRVHGLAAGHGEDDGAEDEETFQSIVEKETRGV